MLPFSKRPPPPEECFLRTGDFEAVRQDSYSGASRAPVVLPATIPPPPRAPVFARQAPQANYGYRQQQQHQNYGQYGDLSAPPPPHSLAPVAMSPDSTGRSYTHSGVSRTNGTIVVREKPSLKWGVMIALSGALLGGVLGLGMDARRQAQRAAAAAADAQDNAPPAMVAAALPNALTATPRPVAAPLPVVLAPTQAAPIAAAAPAPAPVVLAAAAPVVIAPLKAEPAPKVTHAIKAAPPPAKTHFLAAKVSSPPKPVIEKAEAPEPKVAKAEKTEKAEKPAPKKDASTSDAMKILEAANKDTTNTL